MSIDLHTALGAELPPIQFSWTATDVQTYNLAIGAGSNPLNERELLYLDDAKPSVLPTFATVASTFHATEAPQVKFPGIDIDLANVVHGGQEVRVMGPIPPYGQARTTTRISDIWDKGSAAVILQESTTTTPDGTELWRTRSSIFAKGEGGFGGERGPSHTHAPLDRDPDAVVLIPILPQQALMYRMCGDRNPLHSDPGFASAAGFPQPILHGLCTYAMVCRAISAALPGAPTTGFAARFAGVVYPGETLECQIWDNENELTAIVTIPERSGATVLTDVVLKR
ncbi:MaoC/PaaZ C-terminal domain-containing protein [Rhodococcus sp. G-MC3]|uniref:MaoC/PaaZ C-terminal domain-containing protein n=1 Tax=Rhodococcus sp. G-MC3 TaxID=3046209 RepID=UPI0024B8C15A|nr:MaoC/PaaZ C-terminal domain-containing protein [Rhodococcus sp. G-MC3]MDJ0393377.1 MaoC/PaaZ C-terminal domain-containing protein [Rhodococcus sp. G-MC3]